MTAERGAPGLCPGSPRFLSGWTVGRAGGDQLAVHSTLLSGDWRGFSLRRGYRIFSLFSFLSLSIQAASAAETDLCFFFCTVPSTSGRLG